MQHRGGADLVRDCRAANFSGKRRGGNSGPYAKPNRHDVDFAQVPILVSVDHTKFTCTVNGFPRTTTGAVIVPPLTVQLTLLTPVLGNDKVLCNGSLGAVTNSGRVGATWISDLADNAIFSSVEVSNNIGTVVPPTSPTQPQRRLAENECLWKGDPRCVSMRDENANNVRDTVPPAPQFQALADGKYGVDAVSGSLVRVEGQDFETVADATSRAASGTILRKSGSTFLQGEAGYSFDVAPGNYHLWVRHRNSGGPTAIWVTINGSKWANSKQR